MESNEGSGYHSCNSRNEVDRVQGHEWRIQFVLVPSARLVSRQLDDAPSEMHAKNFLAEG
jgi:hypothetical protein